MKTLCMLGFVGFSDNWVVYDQESFPLRAVSFVSAVVTLAVNLVIVPPMIRLP